MSDWTAVAGKSPVQQPGNVVTVVSLTHTPSGKVIPQEFRYDGTLDGLRRVVRAAIDQVDGPTGGVHLVEPGTVLDLADPVPVVPIPPTKEESDRALFFADLRADRQQEKFDALPPALQARCLPEYIGSL